MRKVAAGPLGVLVPGREYDVDDGFARFLAAAGACDRLVDPAPPTPPRPAPEAPEATVTGPPETAMQPRPRGRRR